MSDRATAVNPRLLRWARERAGYTQQQVADKLKRPQGAVEAWEAGTAAPTFRQLEQLAEVIYKRPIALFFFPDPPEEAGPAAQFRTLPASELERLEPDTLFAVREALGFRESLRELAGGRNPAARLITQDLRATTHEAMNGLAASVREYLQTTLQEQFSWSSAEDAFKHWRRAVEAAGVFVFKRALKQKGISGFCLHDETFPLVVVNNSTAHAKQSFTLFHELCHLLFAVGGITKDDDRFVVSMAGVDREIEVACNHFAAEVLVPSGSFPWNELRARGLDDAVEAIAGQYRVSREVILRRLLDAGEVDEAAYEERVAAWNEQYNAARAARGGGGDYYATQATYLGEGFLRLAFGQYYAGQLTLPQLAGHLGMKAKNVPRLQDFVLGAR